MDLCRTICTSVLLLLFSAKWSLAELASFKGDQFISYNLGSKSMNPQQTIIELRFRTIHPNGLLVYSKGENGDFLQLEIFKGQVRYRAYLGGSHKRGMPDILNPTKYINDNKWHNVKVVQEGRTATLKVDSVGDSHVIQEDYKDLNLDEYLYIGGMKPATYRHYRVTGTKNFRGCLEDVMFRGWNLIKGAVDAEPDYNSHGRLIFKCEPQEYRVVSLDNPNSGFKVTVRKLPADNDSFSTSFQFRTHVKDGVLVSRAAVKVKLHVRLFGGQLIYDVIAPNGSKTLVKMGSNLDDGEWHSVNASLKGAEARLLLDGETRTRPLNHSSLMLEFANRSRLKIFAGGHETQGERKFPGFVGCLMNLRIDSQKITQKELRRNKYSYGAVTDSCRLENLCEPNPCLHGGLCSQDWKQYYCNCELTYFEGRDCEIPIYKPTCEYYRAMGLKSNTPCLLDSEGEGRPYTAHCNVTNPSRTYTVITHNKMMETRVGNAKLSGNMYKHDITYTSSVGMDQIEKLIEKSRHCRQHIRFKCISSKLLNTPRGPSHTFWLSRDGKREDYWGGAEPGSQKCACGMTEPSSCKGTAKFCNCDIKDNVWRVDEGYLTDKTTLPVTGFLFNRKSERSYFVLGPLECWGDANKKSPATLPTPRPDKDTTDDRLLKACPMETTPTQSFTNTTKRTRPHPPIDPCPIAEECENRSTASQNITTTAPGPTGNTEQRSQTTSSEGGIVNPNTNIEKDFYGLSTLAIIMICGSIVVVVLLSMKFGLPRVIMCIRTHSKRGEYIVPPAGSAGYPARLLPLVTKRSSVRGRQLTQYGGTGSPRYVDGNASGGIKSYWV